LDDGILDTNEAMELLDEAFSFFAARQDRKAGKKLYEVGRILATLNAELQKARRATGEEQAE